MADQQIVSFKRGDTLAYMITWEGAVASELKSQIRDKSGNLIAELSIEETGTPGTFRVSISDTSSFPLGPLLTDIQRTSESEGVRSSETFVIFVEKDVTQ